MPCLSSPTSSKRSPGSRHVESRVPLPSEGAFDHRARLRGWLARQSRRRTRASPHWSIAISRPELDTGDNDPRCSRLRVVSVRWIGVSSAVAFRRRVAPQLAACEHRFSIPSDDHGEPCDRGHGTPPKPARVARIPVMVPRSRSGGQHHQVDNAVGRTGGLRHLSAPSLAEPLGATERRRDRADHRSAR